MWKPAQVQYPDRRDCPQMWLEKCGRQEFMQGICFDGNKVKKVLSLDGTDPKLTPPHP